MWAVGGVIRQVLGSQIFVTGSHATKLRMHVRQMLNTRYPTPHAKRASHDTPATVGPPNCPQAIYNYIYIYMVYFFLVVTEGAGGGTPRRSLTVISSQPTLGQLTKVFPHHKMSQKITSALARRRCLHRDGGRTRAWANANTPSRHLLVPPVAYRPATFLDHYNVVLRRSKPFWLPELGFLPLPEREPQPLRGFTSLFVLAVCTKPLRAKAPNARGGATKDTRKAMRSAG